MKLFVLLAVVCALGVVAVPVVDSDGLKQAARDIPSGAPPPTNKTEAYGGVTSASRQNLTVIASDPSNNDPSPQEYWKMQVTLGEKRAHVGTYNGDKLALTIREQLMIKCPDNFGRNVCDKLPFSWGPIEYTSIQKCGIWHRGQHRNDANLVLEVYSSYFPSSAPGLRDLFIDHVAKVFGATSGLKVNQYEVGLRPAGNCVGTYGWHRFANAPNKVEISLSPPPYDDLEDNPHLFVRLNLNKDAVEGKWDCVGSIGAVNQISPPHKSTAYGNLISHPVWGWTDCPNKQLDGDCNSPNVRMKFCDPW